MLAGGLGCCGLEAPHPIPMPHAPRAIDLSSATWVVSGRIILKRKELCRQGCPRRTDTVVRSLWRLLGLLAEAAALRESCPAARRLAQHHRTAPAEHDGLWGETGRGARGAVSARARCRKMRRWKVGPWVEGGRTADANGARAGRGWDGGGGASTHRGVGEDGRDVEAARALHVHKERVRLLHQPLQLVLALLVGGARVEEILDLFGGGQERRRQDACVAARGGGSCGPSFAAAGTSRSRSLPGRRGAGRVRAGGRRAGRRRRADGPWLYVFRGTRSRTRDERARLEMSGPCESVQASQKNSA